MMIGISRYSSHLAVDNCCRGYAGDDEDGTRVQVVVHEEVHLVDGAGDDVVEVATVSGIGVDSADAVFALVLELVLVVLVVASFLHFCVCKSMKHTN